MYYVPDDTTKCGLYECKTCGARFLALEIEEKTFCPDCDTDMDYEFGPDDDMEAAGETAQLVQVLEGEDVEMYDKLLSLAVTGGDYEWL